MGEGARKEPRWVTRSQIEVKVDTREDVQRVWTENISRGGLFIATDEPPPMRTRVEVKLDSPDGTLTLKAEVVHVVDAATGKTINMPAGVGLQFVELDTRLASAVAAYVERVAERLKLETGDIAATKPSSNVVNAAQSLLAAAEQNDLYASLGLTPQVTEEALNEKVRELETMFATPPKGLTAAQKQRVEMAQKVLRRVTRLILDPGRRLEYDIRQGYSRIDALLKKQPHEVRKMRDAWKVSFPDRYEQAKTAATAAGASGDRGAFDDAINYLKTALTLDPFNLNLRNALKEFETIAKNKPKS